jgi:hypothetical protein
LAEAYEKGERKKKKLRIKEERKEAKRQKTGG